MFTTWVWAALLCAAPEVSAAGELAPPVRIEGSGGPIDVEVGHAAPYYADFDGDGTPDLLVGQFGGGKLRIYKNSGTASEPKFADHTVFQAGGAEATVPYG